MEEIYIIAIAPKKVLNMFQKTPIKYNLLVRQKNSKILE